MRTRWRIGLLVSASLATSLACGGSKPKTQAPVVGKPSPKPSAKGDGLAPLPAHVIAALDDENATPYFARRGPKGIVVYASGSRWRAQVIGADGAPTGAPNELAHTGGRAPLAALRPVGQGYLFVWVEQVERNHAVKAISIDEAGKPVGAPELVTQSVDELTWIDLLPNAGGALALWEIPRADRSEVVVTPLAGAKASGAGATVLTGALGWEVVATDRGAAFAAVVASKSAGDAAAPKPAPKGDAAKGARGKGAAPKPALAAPPSEEGSGKLGRVVVVEVDATGKAGAPIVVSGEPTAQIDVDIAEVGGRYVVVWTDQRDLDASIYVAAVEPGGKLVGAPRPATPPAGEQALVALIASPGGGRPARAKRALLAWEDLLRSSRDGRLIYLATIGSDGAIGQERATLVFGSSGPPDLVADGDGFAAVTLAPAAVGTAKPGPREPVWPSYVRFGPDLSVVAAEPVRAAPFAATEGVPYLTRSLSCDAGKCMTLASGAGVPASLAAVVLPVRKSLWRASAWRQADDPPPRATAVRALFDGDHLSDVAAASLEGGASLAAWVTYYVEGQTTKKTKGDDTTATLGVRPISAAGVAGKSVIVSRHALSIGGVDLAPAPGGKAPETALAWVARERGESQVFVTKLGADGAKLAQKGVTVITRKTPKPADKSAKVQITMPNEASDAAIAYAGGGEGNDGWVVAWVDTRDGNAEIYTAKVDRSLTKVVPDRRITNALGDAAEVRIAVRGKETFLIWSDARQNPEEGNGDIYLARLDTKTMNKIGEDTRLFASGGHSRSPMIVPTTTGFVVAWIEEGAGGGATKGQSGLRIAQLDDKGAVIGAPLVARGEGGGQVTSAALACSDATCRGVMTSVVGEGLVLGAFDLGRGGAIGPLKTLASLTGAATEDVSPVFVGGKAEQLMFADDSVGGTGRVRWMTITWPAR